MKGIGPIHTCMGRRKQALLRLVLFSIIITAVFLMFSTSAFAAVINVPADQPTIQGAINVAVAGDTINVAPGTYNEFLDVNKSVNIVGPGSSLVTINYGGLVGSNNAGVGVSANNVTIQGVTIDGNSLGTPRYGLKYSNVTGGTVSDVVVQNAFRSGFDFLGVTGATLSDIQSLNNGGHGISLVDSNNVTLSNVTTFGSGWQAVSVATWGNYSPLGTSGIVFSGTNSFGSVFQLEEGDFNNPGVPPAGSAIITYSTNPLDLADVTVQASDFGYAVHGTQDDSPGQNRILFMSTLADAQTALQVCAGGCGHMTGADMYIESLTDATQLYISPGGSIQAAIDAAAAGDTINIAAGTYAGANVDKSVTITGVPGAIINSGPLYAGGGRFECGGHELDYGFQILGPGGSGTTISNLRFETVSFPVYGRGADDVTISGNTLINPLQGVTNNAVGTSGSRWLVSGNVFQDLRADNGGGIGIIMFDYSGGVVQDNIISGNTFTGTMHVNSCESGGYEGQAISLYADFRWSSAGATSVSGNQVTGNTINLVSDTPAVLGVSGIELTNAKDPASPPLPEVPSVVTGNTIANNTMDGALTNGLNIIGASSNSIIGNTVSNADNGISVAESGDGFDGISYSYNNTVSLNKFIGNTVQANVAAGNTGNNFDGNYWSDYAGPGPYLFSGGQDNSPTGPPQVTYVAPTGEVNIGNPLVTATATGGASGGLTIQLGLAGQLDPANPYEVTLWTFGCTIVGDDVSCPTNGLPEGVYTATVTVFDSNGQSGDATGNFNIVDIDPPVTTDDAPAGWQNTDVTVTLTCTDTVSGCASTDWSADNGGGSGTGNTIVVSAEGVTTITYYSTDNVGHVEAPNVTTVSIDKTSPVVTYTGPIGTVYTNVASITGTVTDAAPSSGIDITTGAVLSLDGGVTYPYSCTVNLGDIDCPTPALANGSYSAVISVTDNAGNNATAGGTFTYAAHGKPDLSLSVARVYWASLPDYVADKLSVDYTLTNNSVGIAAENVEITGINNSNSVVLLTTTPIAVSDIAAAASAGFTAKYGLPGGVTQFVSSIYATASDPTGTVYYYPGPYPGP